MESMGVASGRGCKEPEGTLFPLLTPPNKRRPLINAGCKHTSKPNNRQALIKRWVDQTRI